MRILSQRRLRQASPLSADVPCFLFVGNGPAVCDLSRDFACGCLCGGHRFAPCCGAQCKTGRLTVLLQGRQLLAAIKANRPASFAFHFLRRHITSRLFDSWPQVRTLLARKLLSTGDREAALRVFSLRLHQFFVAGRARCFLWTTRFWPCRVFGADKQRGSTDRLPWLTHAAWCIVPHSGSMFSPLGPLIPANRSH